MAEIEKKIEATKDEQAVAENTANPNADLPKKNAVAAEPTHLKNDAEDLGAAVVKPTDSNPDAAKSTKEVSGQAPQKHEGKPDAMPTLKKEDAKKEAEAEDKETVKEGEMPKAALDALKKSDDKKDVKEEDEKKDEKETKAEDKEKTDKEYRTLNRRRAGAHQSAQRRPHQRTVSHFTSIC